MSKNSVITVVIIVLIVLAGGSYALFHKSYMKPAAAPSQTGSGTSTATGAVLVTKTDANLGQYLADANGQALYTYGGDTSGVSNCTGSCLANWPAYIASSSTTSLPAGVSTIKRSDNGKMQYTYNGMPLYTFVGDSAGQVTGNGVSDFSIAKPSSASSSSAPTSSSNNVSGYPY